MLGSLLIGHALRLMPVGETISILYLFPIIVMILAIPLMGEQVSAINWGFAVLGFAGVLMVARPGGGLDTLGIAFALLTAILAAIFHLMTRVLERKIAPVTQSPSCYVLFRFGHSLSSCYP